jgi:hypothetical protein
VTATLVPISDGPESVTVTPGSTDLVLSVTVPLIAPVVEVTVWAAATCAMQASETMRDTTRLTLAISAPPDFLQVDLDLLISYFFFTNLIVASAFALSSSLSPAGNPLV